MQKLRDLGIEHDDFSPVCNHIINQEVKRRLKNNGSDIADMEQLFYQRTHINEKRRIEYKPEDFIEREPNGGDKKVTKTKDIIIQPKEVINIIKTPQNEHEKSEVIHKSKEAKTFFCSKCNCRHRHESPIGIEHKAFATEIPVDHQKETRSPLHRLNIGLSIVKKNIEKTTDPEKLERFTRKMKEIERQIEQYEE